MWRRCYNVSATFTKTMTSQHQSEMSDEELNDDLLQSDDEDQNISSGVSYSQKDYAGDTEHLGEGYDEEQYQHEGEEEYTEAYSQDHNTELPQDQMDYSGEPAEGDDGYQDEVLDLEINEPIDEEFQVSSHVGFTAFDVCACTNTHPPFPLSVQLLCIQKIILSSLCSSYAQSQITRSRRWPASTFPAVFPRDVLPVHLLFFLHSFIDGALTG
uniref:Uncharacterized protein n=1 Tax=Neogobius melanostomus TaxID=47308 RepID=A0A8C6UTK0_9GOBI